MNLHSTIPTLKKPVPADFAEHSSESNRELRARYGVSDKTLAKWRKVTNLPADSGRSASSAARARWGQAKKMPPPNDFADVARRHVNRVLAERYGVSENTISRWRKETGTTSSIKGFVTAPLIKQGVPGIPAGTASEACQYLRPNHRPVYHRVIEGKQYEGQYVVGQNVFSEDELIDYARSKGFKTGAESLRDVFAKYD
jgi:hypothetical protein